MFGARPRVNASSFVVLFLIGIPTCWAAELSRSAVIQTLHRYVALDDEYVKAVNAGQPYDKLGAELDRFTDGALEEAFANIRRIGCRSPDDGLVHELVQFILHTTNSASESPDETLGDVYVCQPDSVRRVFLALPKKTQREYYERFANETIGAIMDAHLPKKKDQVLRRMLDEMAPKGYKTGAAN